MTTTYHICTDYGDIIGKIMTYILNVKITQIKPFFDIRVYL